MDRQQFQHNSLSRGQTAKSHDLVKEAWIPSAVPPLKLCGSMVCRHFAFAPFGRQIGTSRWMCFLPECLLDVSAGGGSTEELAF